jgi:arabinose-5-phosphate isomerase
MSGLNRQEILSSARHTFEVEAAALVSMAEGLDEGFVEAVESMLSCKGKVVVTGMGKSGLVGRKIAATLASTGTPSFFLHPGEAFHGDLGMISEEDIVLALSYSGETDEVLKIVPFIHSNHNLLISLTGNAESTLAKKSDIHLSVKVAEEACALHLAPTSSTTAQIAMGDALAVALMKARQFTSTDFARLHPGGSLGRRLLLTVGDVMRRDNLPVVAADCGVSEMIHQINRGGVGLVVMVENESVKGVVTDGDVRRAMDSRQAEFFSLRAADMASLCPKKISAEAKLIDAEKMMTSHKVNALLVIGDDDRLEGIVHIYDIKL